MTKPKKTLEEVYAQSSVLGMNVRMLMAVNRDSRETVADYLGISRKTMTERLARPWEFRLQELEDLGRRYDVTVSQLAKRPVYVEDEPMREAVR